MIDQCNINENINRDQFLNYHHWKKKIAKRSTANQI